MWTRVGKRAKKMGSDTHWHMKNADFSLRFCTTFSSKYLRAHETNFDRNKKQNFIQMVNTFSPPIKLHIFGLATTSLLLSSSFWLCMQTKCVQIQYRVWFIRTMRRQITSELKKNSILSRVNQQKTNMYLMSEKVN